MDEVTLVPIESLEEWPGNPRRGNAGKIRESIRVNGVYKPLLVQRGTRRIMAGNHTWKEARGLGHTQIAVIFKDVSDDEARRIMLVDNRTSDLADYDEEQLGAVLAEMDDFYGTGYTADEADPYVQAWTGGDGSYGAEGDGDIDGDGSYDELYVLDIVPTGAAYAELPQQEAARAERQAAQVPSIAKGTREIMLVYRIDEHIEMIRMLDGLRAAEGGGEAGRYSAIVQRLVRKAAAEAGIA